MSLGAKALLRQAEAQLLAGECQSRHWRNIDLAQTQLDRLEARLRADAETLSSREAALNSRQADFEAERRSSHAVLSLAEEERRTATSQLEEARRIVAEHSELMAKVGVLRKEAEGLAARVEAVANREQAVDTATRALESEGCRVEEAKVALGELMTKWGENGELFWPKVFRSETWHRLMSDLFDQATGDPKAGGLLAALFRLNFAEQGTDDADLLDAYREIGRRVYAWNSEYAVVLKFASALNESGRAGLRVKVVLPSDVLQAEWMNFRPGLRNVQRVLGWAIFREQGDGEAECVERAEIE